MAIKRSLSGFAFFVLMTSQILAKGKVLISEPFLQDPHFERSVIYLVEHNAEGSLGFVLNNKIASDMNKQLKGELGIKNDLYKGGPVELNTLHFLHQNDAIQDAVEIQKGIFWGGHIEQAIQTIEILPQSQSAYKFFLGYSGWAAGQLQEEVKENTWIISDIHSAFIFGEALESQKFWSKMMKKQGTDWQLLSNAPKHYFLN